MTIALLMSAPSQGTQPIPAGEPLRCSTSQAGESEAIRREQLGMGKTASMSLGSRLSDTAARWLKLKKTSGETELQFAARYVARHMTPV